MRRRRSGTRCPGLVLLTLAFAAAADAATFVVSSTDDMGAGTLRQAILDAGADDTIAFALGPDTTITLASALPDLAAGVQIDATGAPGLTVDGGGNQILTVDAGDAGVVDLGMESGVIGVGTGDTLTFTANHDFEVAAHLIDLGGPGTIVKDGAAALTLSELNVGFTGVLQIDEGKVIGNTTSLPAAITDDAALVFDESAVGTYTGVIQGTGTLEKTGGGTLTLTGANTYTGGTTVSAGTLEADVTSLPGNPVAVAAGARLRLDQAGGAGSFAGDISGAGSFAKSGAGDLTLTGSNTYTGGTEIQEGLLIGDTAAIRGAVDIDAGATLVFDQVTNGTHSGAITGQGGVVKQGTGSVTLAGSNAYSGPTDVLAGTLVVDTGSLPGGATIGPMGRLVFDQAQNGSFDAVLDGAGELEKRGAGTLTLTGIHTFTGGTWITGGTLDLTGSLASGVFVESGGTLGGTGSVNDSVDVMAAGRLSPGSGGAGTLGVGDLLLRAGSTFRVDVSDDGTGDDLLTAGAVVFEPGATLVVDAAPGAYRVMVNPPTNPPSYTDVTVDVIQATSINGPIPQPPDRVFLSIDASEPVEGTLRIAIFGQVDDLEQIGRTPNQKAIGAVLDRFAGDTPELVDPDVDVLFDSLITLDTEDQVRAVLDALSGEPISAFTTARAAMGERFQRSLHRRMRSLLFSSEKAWPVGSSASSAPLRRPAGPTDVAARPRPGEQGVGGWLDGYGILGDLGGSGGAADVDYRIYGTTAGLDFRLGDHGLAGFAGGYARTQLDLDGHAGNGDADTVQGAVYAAWASQRVHAGVSGRYAWSASDSTRRIAVDALALDAHGSFDSHDFGARAELAVNAFETHDVRLQPLAAFDWSHLSRESFRERGAGSLGLDVDAEDLDTSLLQLGARVEALFPVGEDAVLAPELRAFWLNEFGDRKRRVEARLAGAPFTVEGAEAPRTGGLLGVGWTMSLGRNVQAAADYDARIDTDRLEHTGSVSVRVRF